MDKLLVGYGEEVITPPVGTELTGYGYYLDRRAGTVLDELKVRTLFLRRGADTVVISSCDLLGFTVSFSDAVRGRISADYDIPRASIFLACTHTHTGPASLPLPGLGEVDGGYLDRVADAICHSVASAAGDAKPAAFRYRAETVEPIGYNRCTGTFEPIDPFLRAAVFTRNDRKIYLLNYACHAVVRAAARAVSADWPGAVIRRIEQEGHSAVFLQGFCGDINPVSCANHWGKEAEADLFLYGEILSRPAFIAEKYGVEENAVGLRGIEHRISLPLQVPADEKEILEEKTALLASSADAAFRRFADDWAERAGRALPALRKNPFLPDVPIQGLAIGGLRIIALPGEVFCEYGLALQKEYPPLITAGYANGNAGYFPTAADYGKPEDFFRYACYSAPKFYQLFPFTPDVENILLDVCRLVLTELII